MAGKKKPGETYESFVERQIREAAEEGAFENLRGAGRPLPPLHPEVEGWWIKQRMKAEQLDHVPEALEIRREAERVLASLDAVGIEGEVRRRLRELDARIRKVNRTAVAGPPTTVAPLDVEALVRRWRERRAGRGR
ncbi:MAG TPA: DUF1992 domain-containing protein [Anaeromyxobacteraceae bacterium]|nr:DUF1992 domain-containing protein [Anaeromyxobacteraceae bacterium]